MLTCGKKQAVRDDAYLKEITTPNVPIKGPNCGEYTRFPIRLTFEHLRSSLESVLKNNISYFEFYKTSTQKNTQEPKGEYKVDFNIPEGDLRESNISAYELNNSGQIQCFLKLLGSATSQGKTVKV